MKENDHVPENKKRVLRSGRSVGTYLCVLFVIALLLLIIAYLQESSFAQALSSSLSLL